MTRWVPFALVVFGSSLAVAQDDLSALRADLERAEARLATVRRAQQAATRQELADAQASVLERKWKLAVFENDGNAQATLLRDLVVIYEKELRHDLESQASGVAGVDRVTRCLNHLADARIRLFALQSDQEAIVTELEGLLAHYEKLLAKLRRLRRDRIVSDREIEPLLRNQALIWEKLLQVTRDDRLARFRDPNRLEHLRGRVAELKSGAAELRR